MSARSALEVGLKLLGVYWLFNAVFALYKLVFFIVYPRLVHSPNSNVNDVGYSLAILVFYLLAGYLFVFQTTLLLRFIQAPANDGLASGGGLTHEGLVNAGAFLLGCYYLVPALLNLLSDAIKVAVPRLQVMDITGRVIPPYTDIAANALQVILCCVLIFGRGALARAWERFGSDYQEDTPVSPEEPNAN